MDEKAFLRELSHASADLTSSIDDIRPEVWKRLEESKRDAGATNDLVERRWIVRLDLAAAAAIVVGAGILYGWAVALWSDMYWSGSFCMFNHYFQ